MPDAGERCSSQTEGDYAGNGLGEKVADKEIEGPGP